MKKYLTASPSATRARAATAAVLALTLGVATAHAQETRGAPRAAQPAGTEDLFRSASEDYSAGRFAAAIAGYQRAFEVEGRPSALFNIAQVYRAAGNCGLAARYFEQYLGRAPSVSAARREAILSTIRELNAIASVLSVASEPTAARASLNGVELGAVPLRASVCPGTHVLVVQREGHVSFSEELSFTTQRDQLVRVRLAPEALASTLRLEGSPSSARVQIDGVPVGPFPVVRRLAPGGHGILVQAPGFRSSRIELMLASNQQRTERFNLTREVRVPWWAWTLGAAVLTGAAVTAGYFIVRAQEPVCPGGASHCLQF